MGDVSRRLTDAWRQADESAQWDHLVPSVAIELAEAEQELDSMFLTAWSKRVGAEAPDGIDWESKSCTWGGKLYEQLTPGMLRVVALLIEERRKGCCKLPAAIIGKRADVSVVGGFKQQVFKLNRKGGPKLHPVNAIIVCHGGGFFGLIDP